MNSLHAAGKFLDQPLLVSKLQKTMPAILAGGSALYTVYDVCKAEKGKKKERALQTGLTLGAAAASALAAPYMASAITKRALPDSVSAVRQYNKSIINDFTSKTDLEQPIKNILDKAKEKIIGVKDIKKLYESVQKKQNGKEFLEKLIPPPKNVSAKDIFSEIGFLSLYGIIPIAGGIAGGTAADALIDKKNWKKKIPDKIKEGSYQYLANIFMCNIGAGIALGLLEKAGIRSKAARAAGMTAGIIAAGVAGGSKIANLAGKYIIDPVFDKKKAKTCMNENTSEIDLRSGSGIKTLNEQPVQKKERTPELLDMALHTDDIATVSLLSGLKWIEPFLPVLYTVSGYRAGTGYRN